MFSNVVYIHGVISYSGFKDVGFTHIVCSDMVLVCSDIPNLPVLGKSRPIVILSCNVLKNIKRSNFQTLYIAGSSS